MLIKNINDLSFNLHLIPNNVAVDILKRILDWTSSGGTYEDEYVKRQIEYVNKFIKEEI